MRRSLADDDGSAPLESIFAIALLLLLTLGVMQIAFALYGRNVVAASAHEGARAAIELGRGPGDAVTVATRTVRGGAGGLARDVDVDVAVAEEGVRSIVVVRVAAVMRPWGPIPLPIPVSVTATASKESVL